MRPNSCISSVTLCAEIQKTLKRFATNIDTDFIDFGGVERGPEALKTRSEQFFRIFSFLQYYVFCRELCGPELEARGSRLEPRGSESEAGGSRLEAEGPGLNAGGSGWRLGAQGWRLEA